MENTLSPGTFFGRTQRRIDVAGLTFAECGSRDGERNPFTRARKRLLLSGRRGGVSGDLQGRNADGHSPHPRVPSGGRATFQPLARRSRPRLSHRGVSRSRRLAPHPGADHRPPGPLPERNGALARGTSLPRVPRRESGASSLALEGLALEILAEVSRPQREPSESSAPKWLLSARDMLHNRFADPLSLGEIARAVGVHPVHLARVFRHRYGCSLGEYLRRVRVRAACGQLASSERPLADIALEAGFWDQSHFTRLFRQRLHMTPGEFRREFHGARGVPEDVSGVQDPERSPP